jgi:hypothetical protein
MDAAKPLSEQRLFDLSDIVKRTKISARSWRRIIRAGGIGVLRIEGSVRIPEAELERFLTERFVPHKLRRPLASAEIEQVLDRVAPRRRGRPKIEAAN